MLAEVVLKAEGARAALTPRCTCIITHASACGQRPPGSFVLDALFCISISHASLSAHAHCRKHRRVLRNSNCCRSLRVGQDGAQAIAVKTTTYNIQTACE